MLFLERFLATLSVWLVAMLIAFILGSLINLL